jgi:hypothetical protein
MSRNSGRPAGDGAAVAATAACVLTALIAGAPLSTHALPMTLRPAINQPALENVFLLIEITVKTKCSITQPSLDQQGLNQLG